jgi:2-polyprenyl-3-methyl-5-hydroxy-6-metoxy-1,4-benzoquinol methylase
MVMPAVRETVQGTRTTFELISAVRENPFPFEWYHLMAEDHFWFQWRLAATRHALRAAGIPFDRPLRVFEIGGGTGVLRGELEASTQWTIDMTDLQIEALRLAREGRGRNLYYDVTEERPGFREAYDVVLLFDVLEHVQETQPFLRSVLNHLKPGGALVLNVPALQTLFSPYDTAAGHHRRYNRRTLTAELSPFSFRIDALQYWGAGLVPLLLLRKLVLAIRSGNDAEIIRTGFQPPGHLAHAALRALMRVETAVWPAPPVGSSLLLAGRRTA